MRTHKPTSSVSKCHKELRTRAVLHRGQNRHPQTPAGSQNWCRNAEGENLAPGGNHSQLFITFPSEELRYPVVFAKMLLHPAKPDSQAAAQVPAHVALVGPTARMSGLQKSLIIIIMIILNRFTGHN